MKKFAWFRKAVRFLWRGLFNKRLLIPAFILSFLFEYADSKSSLMGLLLWFETVLTFYLSLTLGFILFRFIKKGEKRIDFSIRLELVIIAFAGSLLLCLRFERLPRLILLPLEILMVVSLCCFLFLLLNLLFIIFLKIRRVWRKVAIVIILLCVGLFITYLYKLHSLAIEGNNLFEYRCLQVNPPLIAYKTAFLKYADFLNSYPHSKYSIDDVKNFIDEYIAQMRKYIPEETKWLEMQKKFMDRWDFQLIEPWYIKEASDYQWKMYEGYRDDAKQILSTIDNPESVKNIDPSYISEERQRRDFYRQKYFEFFDKASKIPDWRKRFGSVPIPKGCTKENVIIPNTSGSIDWWKTDGPEATPSGIPIDPYGVS